MKILMQGKIDLLESGGGDRVQIENTARELEKLAIKVDIKTGFDLDYSQYDLVHLFQLDWTPEVSMHAQAVKRAGKPLVLSPIHHSVQEVKAFDDSYTYDFRRIAKILFADQFKRDTFKNIYKSFFDTRKVYPTVYSMFNGLKNMQKAALTTADKILVQTELEAQDLQSTYEVAIDWVKIPNGVGQHFIDAYNSLPVAVSPEGRDYIISIGRIEARKNQLSIIEAVDLFRRVHNIDVKLLFVGQKSTLKHPEYIWRFDNQVKEKNWIYHIPNYPYEKITELYQQAKVCVSASWFETTGLTSLEALFCGTNAVASSERAKEYLNDYVSYCFPANIESIKDAIAQEYFKPYRKIPAQYVEEYTWQNAAKKTLEVYQSLI